MMKSKVWPATVPAMSFNLHLIIIGIDRLTRDFSENCHGSSLITQIEWRGSGRKGGLLRKGFQKQCTSKQHIQGDGAVSWNEAFDHTCKLKRMNYDSYREWIIRLEIKELRESSKGRLPVVAKATMDVAKFSHESETEIRIPINCNIRGHACEASLMVKLQLSELQSRNSTAFSLPQVLSLGSFFRTVFPQNHIFKSQNPTPDPPSSRTSVDRLSHEQSYQSTTDPAMTSSPLDNQFARVFEDNTKEMYPRQPSTQANHQPSLGRLFSWNKSKLRSKSVIRDSTGHPLKIKEYGDQGLDDIDSKQRHQSSVPFLTDSEQTNGLFKAGKWEKKKLVSRDGQMVVVTDIFLASMDQRSERSAGASACTVLAVVIADWLHRNPKALPSRRKFDELVHEGSSEWRKLCGDDSHKEKFSDQHFDLETVLEAKVRQLSVVTEMSYIGFFTLDELPDSFEFLQGAMSFDNIWKELLCADVSEERVYITSWNDHFFVIKVESDAIYLIDTLGERLLEGCNQAYILRFNKESAVYRRCIEPGCQTDDSRERKECPHSGGLDEGPSYFQQKPICEGISSCREYIKGFLAAIPLKELQQDIKRGLVENVPLDRRLQIEFHRSSTQIHLP